ncbi:MAG: hypothetical protein M3220_18890 [Chloroflexota bacterium]|nr:hypothetical protein [Chloroflexota bacterium]
MNALTVRLVRSALLFLALGIALGVAFAVDRSLGALWRPLHAELNLWGWVTLLIYGMAFHMLPRFTGQPLPQPKLAELQSWMAILGVALVATGWLGRHVGMPLGQETLLLGGAVQFSAALLFTFLIGTLLRSRSYSHV